MLLSSRSFGSDVVIEFLAASKPVYSWNAGLVTDRELFVWYSENLSPGPHVCRVSVGGVVAEKAFVVGTTETGPTRRTSPFRSPGFF